MARGRKPDTNETKRVRGITRPSRLHEVVVNFPKPEKVPAMPSWVTYPGGIELWNRIAPILHEQNVLTLVDVSFLGHLCQVHGEILDSYARGESVPAHKLAQLRLMSSEFGLTPVGRTRLPKNSAKKRENPFNKNGNRPKA